MSLVVESKRWTAAMSEAGLPVDLYIYDLTLGFASLLAPAIIGEIMHRLIK